MVKDVLESPAAMQRMVEVSGQSLTPTFEFGDCIIADFSVDEFLSELEQWPEVRIALGLGDDEN
ncbi:MAG: hypothetical protein LR015_07630 [Verrucomicrobia bacterium]|nr:hypothetical protein [Verrucomicrobiota bacterium]